MDLDIIILQMLYVYQFLTWFILKFIFQERKNKVMYNKQEDRGVENLDTLGEKTKVKKKKEICK